MTRPLRILLSLTALAAPVVLLAACGGVPGNAVAQVDGETIERSEFDRWMLIAAKSGGQPGATVPRPPDYQACVAAQRKATPKPAKGQPAVTDTQLKAQCRQQYETLREQVLGLLASFQWIEGEAEEMDITVTDAEVQKDIATIKKEPQFKEAGSFEKFLKETGYTNADVVVQERTKLLTDKIRDEVTKGSDEVSNAEIKTYYDKNRQRFAQPERRDLRVVLTKTEARADQAKAALESGDSFSTVARRFSIDQASKTQGGKLPGVAKGQQEAALDKAVFTAERGELEGPVKTQFGYYVFQVGKVTAASQQTLQQAQPTIKQLLVSQKQQTSIEEFAKTFQEKWKEKTECREGFVVQSCKGAPEPTPTPAAQQVPGQPPTQAPPAQPSN